MTRFFAAVALIVLIVSGCTNDSAVAPPSGNPCSADTIPAYGSGSMNFMAAGAGDSFSVSGRYKPSSRFLTDTASAGVGGFLRDTTVGGQLLHGELTGYHYTLTGGMQSLRLMVFTILNDSGRVSAGVYAWASNASAPHGKAVKIHYQFFSDALGVYSTFEARSGSLTITSLDTCARRITGTFSGSVWIPPDTTTQILVQGGRFDVAYASRYFIY
jgi:hypothetical protein